MLSGAFAVGLVAALQDTCKWARHGKKLFVGNISVPFQHSLPHHLRRHTLAAASLQKSPCSFTPRFPRYGEGAHRRPLGISEEDSEEAFNAAYSNFDCGQQIAGNIMSTVSMVRAPRPRTDNPPPSPRRRTCTRRWSASTPKTWTS